MSVVTRIDSRSKKNNKLVIQHSDGTVLATIEALSIETTLRVGTADDVVVVKSNGAVLERKK